MIVTAELPIVLYARGDIMHYLTEDEVISVFRRFEDRTLQKAEWTHAAHLTVGLCYLVRHPIGVALNLMRDGICWLNDRHGTPNTDDSGYHETLTLFWLDRINEFLETDTDELSLLEKANQCLDALLDRDLPLRSYSRELLFSPAARRGYIEPDLSGIEPLGSLQQEIPNAA